MEFAENIAQLSKLVLQYVSDCTQEKRVCAFDVLISSLWMTYHLSEKKEESRSLKDTKITKDKSIQVVMSDLNNKNIVASSSEKFDDYGRVDQVIDTKENDSSQVVNVSNGSSATVQREHNTGQDSVGANVVVYSCSSATAEQFGTSRDITGEASDFHMVERNDISENVSLSCDRNSTAENCTMIATDKTGQKEQPYPKSSSTQTQDIATEAKQLEKQIVSSSNSNVISADTATNKGTCIMTKDSGKSEVSFRQSLSSSQESDDDVMIIEKDVVMIEIEDDIEENEANKISKADAQEGNFDKKNVQSETFDVICDVKCETIVEGGETVTVSENGSNVPDGAVKINENGTYIDQETALKITSVTGSFSFDAVGPDEKSCSQNRGDLPDGMIIELNLDSDDSGDDASNATQSISRKRASHGTKFMSGKRSKSVSLNRTGKGEDVKFASSHAKTQASESEQSSDTLGIAKTEYKPAKPVMIMSNIFNSAVSSVQPVYHSPAIQAPVITIPPFTQQQWVISPQSKQQQQQQKCQNSQKPKKQQTQFDLSLQKQQGQNFPTPSRQHEKGTKQMRSLLKMPYGVTVHKTSSAQGLHDFKIFVENISDESRVDISAENPAGFIETQIPVEHFPGERKEKFWNLPLPTDVFLSPLPATGPGSSLAYQSVPGDRKIMGHMWGVSSYPSVSGSDMSENLAHHRAHVKQALNVQERKCQMPAEHLAVGTLSVFKKKGSKIRKPSKSAQKKKPDSGETEVKKKNYNIKCLKNLVQYRNKPSILVCKMVTAASRKSQKSQQDKKSDQAKAKTDQLRKKVTRKKKVGRRQTEVQNLQGNSLILGSSERGAKVQAQRKLNVYSEIMNDQS